MAALKKLFIIVFIVAAIIAAIPLFIPYDHFRPNIESAMRDRLQTEVSIGPISFNYSQKPSLVLEHVVFGKSGEGSIGKVLIPLTMRNLLYINHELTDITLEDTTVRQDFAVSLPSHLKPNPGHRDVHFESLKLTNANVTMGKGVVGPLSGVVKFNEDGTFKDITLSDKDDHAEVNIKPTKDKFALTFNAKNWDLPGPYPARFDQLTIRGSADHDGVVVDDINGLIFSAVVVGQAQLSWQDGWKLNGSLETKGMHAEDLIGLVSENTRATGRMTGSATFKFEGTGYDDLLNHPVIAMNFTINDGDLHNFDLIAPLKSQDPSSLKRGGQTRFETLSGVFSTDGQSSSLTNIALNGGKLSATGTLNIDEKRQLNGHITSRLSSGTIAVDAPLTITGKLDEPEIRSGGAYKPGGMTGTTQIF